MSARDNYVIKEWLKGNDIGMMKFSEVFGPIKWHMLACAVVFMLMPAIGRFLSAEAQFAYAVVCEFATNIVITVTCIWVSISEGFKWYYPIAVIFLYVISLFMLYPALTSSMTFNVVSYLVTAYVCHIIGMIIGRIIDRNK